MQIWIFGLAFMLSFGDKLYLKKRLSNIFKLPKKYKIYFDCKEICNRNKNYASWNKFHSTFVFIKWLPFNLLYLGVTFGRSNLWKSVGNTDGKLYHRETIRSLRFKLSYHLCSRLNRIVHCLRLYALNIDKKTPQHVVMWIAQRDNTLEMFDNCI